jgi:hypothetical protein
MTSLIGCDVPTSRLCEVAAGNVAASRIGLRCGVMGCRKDCVAKYPLRLALANQGMQA